MDAERIVETPNLTYEQETLFLELKAIIKAHREGYTAVGIALQKIRDLRLYRATHSSFESFVAEEFMFGKSWAYKLISVSTKKVSLPFVEKVSTRVDTLPTGGGHPSLAGASPPPPAPKRYGKTILVQSTPPPPPPMTTSERAIPPRVRDALADTRFGEAMRFIGQARGLLDRLTKDPSGVEIKPQTSVDLRNAFEALKFARPYKPCPYPHFDETDGCKACDGHIGWVTKTVWDACPADIRGTG